MKRNKGAITLYVLVAMMFFIMALMGTFMIVSNRLKNEKEISKQIQKTYETGDINAIYNSYIGGEIVPIYNEEQFSKVDSNAYIAINDEGGKMYEFSTTAKYVLRNDIMIDAKNYGTDSIWEEIHDKINSLGTRLELSGYNITIILLNGTSKIYEGKIRPQPVDFTPSMVEGETGTEDGKVVIAIDGSEFVWIPVANPALDVQGKSDTQINTAIAAEVAAGRYPMAIKVNSTDYKGVLYNFTGVTSVTITARTYLSEGTDYREPDALTSSLRDNNAANYSAAGITGITNAIEFKAQLQNEYNQMIARVIEKGGFYLGRYETSLNGEMAQSKADVNPMTNINWYHMYQKQKLYASNSSMKEMTSSMIWGSQWDQILIWLKDIPNQSISRIYILDSRGMGNYSGAKINTGINNDYKVKNIYDMAGNVWEWTIEAISNSSRALRGGDYPTSGAYNPASYRGYNASTGIYNTSGSRIVLY